LQLPGIDELLEARDLAVAYLPYVADLGVEVSAGLLVGPGVATFDNDRGASIVKLPGVEGETVPLGAQLDEKFCMIASGPRQGAPLGWYGFPSASRHSMSGSIAPSTAAMSPRPKASYRVSH
jgi:hypothetical protein